MSNKKMVLTGVLVLVLVGAVIFGVVAWKNKQRAEEMAPAPVSFTVVAEGWSQETSSPIPIQVTGETADKEKVDVKYFLGASDKDLSLKPGIYEVEVYASPVNANGGMYRCPKAVKVSVPKNTGGKQNVSKPEKTGEAETQPSASASADSGSVVSAEFELSPIPANEITDEDIEKAQSAMKDAGLDEAKIKTFTDSARTARQAELDRFEKERKAKEEAELMQKTFGPFAGEYWFSPAITACGMSTSLTLDGTGKAHGGFALARMGGSHSNEFSITFSNPVPRADGFEADYQIFYAHAPGSIDTSGTYPCDTPESCTYDDLGVPSSGKAIFYNAGAFQSDSHVSGVWEECHICSPSEREFLGECFNPKPSSSSVRVMKLQGDPGYNSGIFFSK